ncbi:MAG TPA: CARDB domain-containing protein, partial [Cyclobacteriaceae bacterium]
MKSTFLVLVFLSFSLLCFSQDIVVTGVSGNQTFEQSTALTATATFKNEGIVTTASFSIRAVLSSDQTIDSNDHSLYASSNISLAPGESKTVDLKSFTSANAPVGNYYLIIKADEYNSVSETDETNNILITSGYSVIPGNVDLIFQSCTLDPSTIGRFGGTTVHYTIVNTGTTSLYKRVWTTFYLSSDNVLSGDDTKLDFRISNPVSNQITANLSLPLPNVAVGNYYILGAVDNTTSVKELTTETDETNNVVAVPLTITAPNIDLELSEFRNLIYMNGMFTFDFTIRNNGTTAVYIDLDDITLWADYMPLPPPSGIIGRVINPGETQYYYAVNVFYFNSGTVNKYTLHVNESRSITEVNYNNNSLEFGIVFDPPDPIVNVTAASWAGTFYQTDTELSIEATFSNIGESYYTHYPLAFKITNSLGQIVHTDYEYFSDSYFESGGTRTRQY